MRISTVLPIAVFAALAAVFGAYLWEIGPGGKQISEIPSVLIDRPAPAFTLPPIAGRTDGLASADIAGQVALVNVFASWCPPCRAEHPNLMTLAAEGVPIYGIDYKDRPEDVGAYLAEHGNPYRRIGADNDGRVAIDWGVYGYPETFVLDRKGRIRYKQIGPIMAHDLETRIRPLLKRLAQ